MTSIPNLKYKTTLCLSWLSGVDCVKNDDCYFAHGQQQLRTLEQNRIAIADRNRNANSSSPVHNYKTVFCKFYGKGECRLGDACTFAHERREKVRRSNSSQTENEAAYQQYFAYYQLTAWLAQYAPYGLQYSADGYCGLPQADAEKEAEQETLTADSPSPALSKSSRESESFEKESFASEAPVGEQINEDER